MRRALIVTAYLLAIPLAAAADAFAGGSRAAVGARPSQPLYFYVGDRQPGQILCQNAREFGGLWLIVRPTGKLVR